jgi:hypothetical protein
MQNNVGNLFMIDGKIWRCCGDDSTGGDLHKVNSWETKHYELEDWKFFLSQFEVIGSYLG